ncbi:MAG TPA: nucleoside triphosphate pyrophosphohydrolase [Acidobacteriaceae bacterium]|nr:nucleoside triphosphate pyrophosphohydrolase [Acidobacteriaceae bacterium]
MDSPRDSAKDSGALFAEAAAIMARLRAPGGCPWDREQTLESIQPYTLEEVYEVFDAIERGHWTDLCEELGDLLLQILFYSEIAAEAGHFSIADVVAALSRKLVRRHPHVFGDEASAAAGNGSGLQLSGAADSAQVLRNWEAIKQSEKTDRPVEASSLDAVSRAMPALSEARKLGSRAARSGFDWPDAEGLFEKLREETAELRHAMDHPAWKGGPSRREAGGDSAGSRTVMAEETTGEVAAAQDAVAAEIGDLLFTAVNLARHLKVDPEFALRGTNAKFRRRFAFMESVAAAPLETLSAAELELLWNQAKAAETHVSARTK